MSAQNAKSSAAPRRGPSDGADAGIGRLRILATTDLHMNILGFDYAMNRPSPGRGLAGLATLIAGARSEARAQDRACLLLDNGDVWQGTPMGDLLVQHPVTAGHPMAAALNALEYDAAGLGNHDLDYGLAYVKALAATLGMPLISTNLYGGDLAPIAGSAMLDRALPGSPGAPERRLRVGVLSVVPPQTAAWNDRQLLAGGANVGDPFESLRREVPALRTRGADLVVVLAHMGFGPAPGDSEDHDPGALPLTGIPGIDTVIGGHSHRRFPGPDHAGQPGLDVRRGTIGDMPAAMPGVAGAALAVIDLDLAQDARGGWQVAAHRSALRTHADTTPPDPRITALAAPWHRATVNYLDQPVGRTDTALHSYFGLVAPSATAALVARAQARVVRDALRGTDAGALPLLASISASGSGGHAGPANFLNIAPGPVLRRHLAKLFPYPDQTCALRVTGSDLRRWLEHAARLYATLRPEAPDQPLLNDHFPGFNFDTVFGLHYVIDPCRAPGDRIRDLTCRGRPVEDGQAFILTTSQFRIAGGGGYPILPRDRIALRSKVAQTDALIAALAAPDDLLWRDDRPWTLAGDGTRRAVFETSPEAMPYLGELARFAPEPLCQRSNGFARIRLTL